MASSTFVIRCKTENGSYTLEHLDGESTIEKLKMCLQELTNIKPERMKLLCGYPPKPLNFQNDTSKLNELNIHSGDTIIVETHNVPKLKENAEKKDVSNDNLQSGIMLRHVVPANNSCLFTSVSCILSNGEVNGVKCEDFRRIIADAVVHNNTKYSAAVLGMPNAEYCQWILNPDHWGGGIELAILSEYFKMEIVAVDTVSLTAHHFGESFCYSNRAFLIYDGIHYDPLVLELGNDRQTIFPRSDSLPLEMAMEIAREAKSSRQFTDVANFTLSCMTCKIQLRGDAEARNHAMSTGHVNFGEL